MALIRSNTVAIGGPGGGGRFCPTGGTGSDRIEANSSAGGVPLRTCVAAVAPDDVPITRIGGLGHIDASFGQSCDDTDRPCMSSGPTTTENQSDVFNHLPIILARGDRAAWEASYRDPRLRGTTTTMPSVGPPSIRYGNTSPYFTIALLLSLTL